VLPKKDAQAVVALMSELEQSLDKVVADVNTLKSEIAQSTIEAYDKVHKETTAANETYENMMHELTRLRKQGLQLDPIITQMLDRITQLLDNITSRDFFFSLNQIESEIKKLQCNLSEDVGTAVDEKLYTFYTNANDFTHNVQNAVQKATEQMNTDQEQRVEKFGESIDKLLDAKTKQFEKHIRRIEFTEDTLRNWKWWVYGIVAVAVLWAAAFIGVGIKSWANESSAKEELKECREDAYYWQMFRYANPKTAAKFQKELKGNK
jgi:predicted  nucleic acid-binding Zn-ribbon protein